MLTEPTASISVDAYNKIVRSEAGRILATGEVFV